MGSLGGIFSSKTEERQIMGPEKGALVTQAEAWETEEGVQLSLCAFGQGTGWLQFEGRLARKRWGSINKSLVPVGGNHHGHVKRE